jgi:trehalose 2-sulfotransferase
VAAPTLSCLIAFNQRSGSTMLSRALSDTGVAGRPEEYFLSGPTHAFPPGWTFWEEGPFAASHAPISRGEYLELVYRLGTTPNGVFGVKLGWNNVPWVLDKLRAVTRFAGLDRAAAFHALLPNVRVVRLVRRDRVAQAVSWARAAQDGVWVVSDDEPAQPSAPPDYDAEFIANLERLIVEGEQGWLDLCDELGVVPLDVVYEDLADPATYPATVGSVVAHLGIDPASVTIASPRTHRQADEINRAWVERYRAERGASSIEAG